LDVNLGKPTLRRADRFYGPLFGRRFFIAMVTLFVFNPTYSDGVEERKWDL
jgi:hypothetical protein